MLCSISRLDFAMQLDIFKKSFSVWALGRDKVMFSHHFHVGAVLRIRLPQQDDH